MDINSQKLEAAELAYRGWPELHLRDWEETYSYLHLMTQIVGKIKLQLSEFTNHWWNVALFVSSCGLTSGLIPYHDSAFELEFDFIHHQLIITMADGRHDSVELKSGTVAAFYYELMSKLNTLGIFVQIWTVPVEIDDRLPLDKDYRFRNYSNYDAHRFWKILVNVSRVMRLFRSGFTGKASPVHFFWGSMDLAVTFFSGRPAPEHPGAPNVGRQVMVESYNAELASFGFWGGKGVGDAAFYSYAYPVYNKYDQFTIEPIDAYYNSAFSEFILPYHSVIQSDFPEDRILEFYRSAYKAAVELGNWDRHLYRESL